MRQGTPTDCGTPDGCVTASIGWTDPPDTIAIAGEIDRANERLARALLADAVPQGSA